MATAPYIITDQKSQLDFSPDRRISRQMDELQRISSDARDRQWGANWVQEMKDFHALSNQSGVVNPSYRPRVIIPELQFLAMSEATDLTNDTPKVFISVDGKRDEEREKAFTAAWKLGLFSNRIFDAVMWSRYVNPSWLQIGFAPDARNGKGMVWVRARDPETVYPDPHAKNDRDWSFVVLEDWFYIDDIRRMWPEKGKYVRVYGGSDDSFDETEGSKFDLSMELPGDSSLRYDAPEGFENTRKGPRARVRLLFIKDSAKERVENIAGTQSGNTIELIVKPLLKWKYPGGRFIVECNGVVLADGPNFVPRLPEDDFATFPLVGVWSFPHLDSIFGPPPIRYGKNGQELAERMYTQVIENMIRTNNAQYWIPQESQIDIDAFGGLPGEVQVYAGDKPPTMNWPNAIPAHMTQIPELLLQKVARYQGFSPSRQGEAGQGNVSPDLFDASVFQSQTLTRMSARMLAESYQRLAQIAFQMMVRFKTLPDRLKPSYGDKPACTWNPVADGAECDLQLDEASIQALSSVAMQRLALALAKTPAALGLKDLYNAIGLPNADELADAATKAQELSAISKLKRPR